MSTPHLIRALKACNTDLHSERCSDRCIYSGFYVDTARVIVSTVLSRSDCIPEKLAQLIYEFETNVRTAHFNRKNRDRFRHLFQHEGPRLKSVHERPDIFLKELALNDFMASLVQRMKERAIQPRSDEGAPQPAT